ncbi:MAG: hypothetical protein JSU96_16455, partial [Acidobacteriota bacterium]
KAVEPAAGNTIQTRSIEKLRGYDAELLGPPLDSALLALEQACASLRGIGSNHDRNNVFEKSFLPAVNLAISKMKTKRTELREE